MINRELLLAALARVEFEDAKEGGESLWDQSVWCQAIECGTTFCYAGWIVFEAAQRAPQRISLDKATEADEVIVDGENVHMRSAAMQICGLSGDEANLLFAPSNSLSRLKARLHELFKREDEQFAEKKGERL